MRKHRHALVAIIVAAFIAAIPLFNATPTPKEAAASWRSSLRSPTIPSQPRADLLTTQSLDPLAVYATAVEDNQAAQAFAAAEAELASKEAASSSTPPASGPSAPASTSTPTGACGAEDSIEPAAAARAEAAGVPCAWVPTAVCEEQGYDGWGGPDGFFGIQEWNGFDGYPDATAAPLSVQLGWESAHGQGPPDAPGQCHGY